MRTLLIGVLPHLIPAPTIPGGYLERAMTEPLAEGRDEVIYLVCTHPRVRFGARVDDDGARPIFRAKGDIGGMEWDHSAPWARVRLPEHAHPSRLGWAIIDPALESVEHLPAIAVDESDYDGEEGRFRAELMPWIFDRHVELGGDGASERGTVEGGDIRFRLEYIGKRMEEALRRPAGAHHKVPVILGSILLYEPWRLVYFLPCDLHADVVDAGPRGGADLLPLADAARRTGLGRELLIAAAEEALIELLGTRYNERNTKSRRFPNSTSGEQLAAFGIEAVFLQIANLPERVTIIGTRGEVSCDTQVTAFRLST